MDNDKAAGQSDEDEGNEKDLEAPKKKFPKKGIEANPKFPAQPKLLAKLALPKMEGKQTNKYCIVYRSISLETYTVMCLPS